MADPAFAKNLRPKFLPFEIPGLAVAGEGVRGSAGADDGFSGVEEIGEDLVLLVVQLAETRADDDEVGIFDGLDPVASQVAVQAIY